MAAKCIAAGASNASAVERALRRICPLLLERTDGTAVRTSRHRFPSTDTSAALLSRIFDDTVALCESPTAMSTVIRMTNDQHPMLHRIANPAQADSDDGSPASERPHALVASF